MRGGIGRTLRQGIQFLRNADDARTERQLAAELVQLVEIEAQGAAAVQASGLAQRVGGDKRIAVAIAADPAPQSEEAGDLLRRCFRIQLLQLVLQRAIEARHLAQKGVVVVAEAVGDLVENRQLGAAQEARLPQGRHGTAQLRFDLRRLLVGQPHAIALLEQRRDRYFECHDALAPHLRRVRGQHRADEGGVEEAAQIRHADPGFRRAGQSVGHRAGPRRGTGQRMRAGSPDMMLVLGDIGQVREIGAGTNEPGCLLG